jgi:hypothetical protein
LNYLKCNSESAVSEAAETASFFNRLQSHFMYKQIVFNRLQATADEGLSYGLLCQGKCRGTIFLATAGLTDPTNGGFALAHWSPLFAYVPGCPLLHKKI